MMKGGQSECKRSCDSKADLESNTAKGGKCIDAAQAFQVAETTTSVLKKEIWPDGRKSNVPRDDPFGRRQA